MHVTYHGHSTVGLELDGTRLVTDPLLRGRIAHIVRIAPPPTVAPPDAVLISHAHHDHLDPPSLRLLGPDVPLVVPRGTGRLLARHGFAHVVELAVGQTARVGALVVHAVEAIHHGGRPPQRLRADAVGYVIEGTRRVYFAGDTDLFDGMAALGRPALDLALVPVSGWGPRTPAGHLDPARAAHAVGLLAPRVAVPIHWGTYATVVRRRERPGARTAPAEAFRDLVAGTSPATRVIILEPGSAAGIHHDGAPRAPGASEEERA